MLGMNIDAKSERAVPGVRCPACGTVADQPRCPACGIWMAGDQAAELRWIEAELRRIDEARTWLFNRRAAVLADLVKIPAVSTGQQESFERVARETDLAQHELSRRAAGRS